MAKPKKTPTPQPIVDVAKPPAKTSPDAAKPVIVTHRKIMPDPAISEAVGGEEPQTVSLSHTAALPKPSGEEIVEVKKKPAKLATPDNNPLAGIVAGQRRDPDTDAAEPDTELPEPVTVPTPTVDKPALEPVLPEDASEKPTEESEKMPAAELAAKLKTPEVAEAEEVAPAEEPDEAVGGALPQEQKPVNDAEHQQEVAAEHEAVLEKLAQNRQYYLSINSVEKRRTRRFVILGILLSIILALAWVDIALDAGIIKLGGLKPLTHLFSR